jgi:hypothetical protein
LDANYDAPIAQQLETLERDIVVPLKTVADVDLIIQTQILNDRQSANLYKREFINYVIYRSIYGPDNAGPNNDGVFFDLIWFNAQVMIFLSRKNGSIGNVIKEIVRMVKELRSKHPNYPLIPSDFFVAVVQMIATVNSMSRWHQAGRKNIPKLVEAIQQKEFY